MRTSAAPEWVRNLRTIAVAVTLSTLILIPTFHAARAKDTPVGPSRPPAVSTTQALIDECGETPVGAVPASAVVTLPGKVERIVDSSIGFDIWEGPDGVPDTGDERPGILHDFCG